MLRSGAAMPSLAGATRWINRTVEDDDLRGHPVLIQFWAVSCHLCKDNLPTLREWQSIYGPRGVAFVSVHMPRQPSDTAAAEVELAVRTFGMTEPVAVDNEHVIGQRFETDGLWPVYFLFDAEGKLRARAAGAAGLGVLWNALERVLSAP